MPEPSATCRAADETVAALHPYGERTAEHTAAAAAQLAELVRYLNVASLDNPAASLPDPNTIAAVLGSLKTAFERLPQLLDQLAVRVRTLAEDPQLASGSSTHTPQLLAFLAVTSLADAHARLGQLAATVGEAFRAVDHLHLDTDEDDE